MGDWSYGYDALGNLTSQTDAKGCITTLSYDALNRLTGKTYNLLACGGIQTLSYTYDAFDEANGQYGRGYRTGMTDGSGSTSFDYDTRRRVNEQARGLIR